jgi:hypothetical protein
MIRRKKTRRHAMACRHNPRTAAKKPARKAARKVTRKPSKRTVQSRVRKALPKPAARKSCKRCTGGVRYTLRKTPRGQAMVYDRRARKFLRMSTGKCRTLVGPDAEVWFAFLSDTERQPPRWHRHRGNYEIFPATDGTWLVVRDASILKEGLRNYGLASAWVRRVGRKHGCSPAQVRAMKAAEARARREDRLQERAARLEEQARVSGYAKARAGDVGTGRRSRAPEEEQSEGGFLGGWFSKYREPLAGEPGFRGRVSLGEPARANPSHRRGKKAGRKVRKPARKNPRPAMRGYRIVRRRVSRRSRRY